MFDPLPLIFYIRYLPDPTRGAPPTCSIWFHIGLLHTIVDKRLGIFESYECRYSAPDSRFG
jgi:hypothetical protein